MVEQHGIVEEVFNRGFPGKVHYLPQRPVIKSDQETTRVLIVLDTSVKIEKIHH